MASQRNGQDQSLAGKVALISGSSAGIGAAIALELSRHGASVIINYPFPSDKAAATAILQSLPTSDKSIISEADLTTFDGAKQLAAVAAKTFGHVDILVNNAGYSGFCNISEASDSEIQQTWEKTVNLNGRGTFFLTYAVLPILAPGGSRIINLGSSTSRDPDPHMGIYAGTKGMIESFTRSWARDLPRRHGCTVNAVIPGPTGTEALLAAESGAFAGILQARKESTPVAERFSKPEEIAWAVRMLCDEGARWVNGAFIPVTGEGHCGSTARVHRSDRT